MDSIIRYANQDITEIDPVDFPSEIPIIPLRNAVVLPGVLLPIFVGRNESVELIEKLGQPGTLVGLFTQISPSDELVEEKNLHRIGTIAEIHRVLPMSEGGYQVFLQGVQKVNLIEVLHTTPYLVGKVGQVREIQDSEPGEFLRLQTHVIRYIENHPGIPDEIIGFIRRLKNPAALANQIVFFSNKENEEKINYLQLDSIAEKIEFVLSYLTEETSRLLMEKEVHEKVEKDTNRIQREFYLRKQLETIRKELGESGDEGSDELYKQLEEKWLPDPIRTAVDKEIRRLKRAEESPHGGGFEASQIRNWLELILELPWDEPKPVEINLKRAEEILNDDHEGLEEVKKRILEFLAVEKQTGGAKAPILCLVGPPGVGKTSLARSVARAMNRPLVRAALGGIRDEAEIRGHRKTYVGALPGKILASMKKAATRDPVFLLDEIDKMGVSYNGDPSAAMLEVLDPEQNHAFEDHYLGHPYDLSRVLFIATANSIDSIPIPLRDRMEIVQLSGYTVAEKRAIATKHLLPEILQQLKMEPEQIHLTTDALDRIITAHTREAGVRSLKRKIESIARKTIRKLVEARETETTDAGTVSPGSTENQSLKIVYGADDIPELLGRDRFMHDLKENFGIPGVAVGLAWTPVGGDILYIETTCYDGKGDLKLSGQLGDVMKESAVAALSFLRSHTRELGIDPELFGRKDIHIHIPSGATPKDGPSAGVTLLSALTSLFTGRPVAPNIAMTGEISLRGRILPVGGIKEKVLAARAAGIQTVLLPEKNRADFEEIPSHVTEGLEAEYFSDMMELLKRTIPGIGELRKEVVVDREGW